MPDTPVCSNPHSIRVGSVVKPCTSPVSVIGQSRVVPLDGDKYKVIELKPGFQNDFHVRVAEIKEDGSEETVYATFHLSSFKPETQP